MGKKRYTGLVISLVIYMALMTGIAFLPGLHAAPVMRLTMLGTVWYLAGLSFHIWRTEQIYWYNGVTYEEAEAAGAERRKVFAWKHFRIFGLFALLMMALSCVMQLLGWSAWIDFTAGTIGICAACFMTVPLKL